MNDDLISRSTIKHAIYDVCLRKNNIDIFEKLLDRINELPSVNPQEPKTDVLDKIRAEIEKPLHDERCFDTADAKAQYIALNWCVEIIDKYRTESEE